MFHPNINVGVAARAGFGLGTTIQIGPKRIGLDLSVRGHVIGVAEKLHGSLNGPIPSAPGLDIYASRNVSRAEWTASFILITAREIGSG